MNNKYLIVADDFTGANDTGVQMSNRGVPVKVMLFPTDEKQYLSLVLDTESRNITKIDAYNKVESLTKKILENNTFELIYKKVDSTLRGNVIEEIKALDAVYEPDKIVFAPAFPQIGRTTENGVHKLNGIPLMQTEFAKDPLSPIVTDNIINMLEMGYEETVKHHTIEEIRENQITLAGNKLHTFDSENHTDLMKIADTLLGSNEKILWVGSAGLANAVFQILYPEKPALAVVGSISENSLKQMAFAEQKGYKVVKLSNEELFAKERVQKVGEKVSNYLKKGEDVILTAARTREDYEDTLLYASELKMNKDDTSWYVQNSLANITKEILSQTEIAGLFLTGGATAISIMDALNTTSVEIKEEIITGTVHSVMTDGPYENMNIVTKAGAFGKNEDLVYSLERIREM